MSVHESALYPRSYSASFGWKVGIAMLGFFLGALGLAGAWFFGRPPQIHNYTQLIVVIVLVAICLSMAVLGFWGALGTLLGKTVVLTNDELHIPRVYGTKVIQRSAIAGYRVKDAGGSYNVLELQYFNPQAKRKKTSVTMLFKLDDAFQAWFETVPYLDAVELAASVQEIEKDAELGDTPGERRVNVERARKIAGLLHVGSLLVAPWALFYPRPYLLMFLVVASLPWIALWLCWKYKGSFTLDDLPKNGFRGNLSLILIIPGIVLGFRALTDVQLINVSDLVLPALTGLVLMLVLLAWVDPVYRTSPLKMALAAFVLSAYAASFIAIANMLFDIHRPQTYRVQVLEKHHTTGKGAAQYFEVPAWGPHAHDNEIHVPRALYRQTEIGQTVCVRRHPGALRLEWYSVVANHAC